MHFMCRRLVVLSSFIDPLAFPSSPVKLMVLHYSTIGTYSDTDGQSKCTPCTTGRYQSNPGLTACIDCPRGTSISTTGNWFFLSADDRPTNHFLVFKQVKLHVVVVILVDTQMELVSTNHHLC
jgi:hypothetical protein